MRILLTFILALSLVQPAMAQSWFQRMFDPTVKETSFTAQERQEIADYFARKAGYRSDRQEKYHDDDYDDNDDGKGKGKKKKKHGKKKGKDKGLPPGLAKKDTLPPGLAKQLEKNGTLPPGLAKKDLPHDLLERLPARYKGHERVIVGDDVVLLERTTGVVLDVLRDVMSGSGRY